VGLICLLVNLIKTANFVCFSMKLEKSFRPSPGFSVVLAPKALFATADADRASLELIYG
jgi:uncharacterized membrane protein